MKCPQDKNSELTELHVGGTVAHVCKDCHGLLFKKTELEALKDNIEAHGWFDISLWEEKELLRSKQCEEKCPACSARMCQIDWKEGALVSLLCPACGSLWLPKGEYEKAIRYIKDTAGGEILENYSSLLSRELDMLMSGEKGIATEAHNFAALLRYLEYRFITKHPVLTEIIEELPFAK